MGVCRACRKYLAHVERGAEAAVARVLLVGESEHGELLAAHRVEHLANLGRGRGRVGVSVSPQC